MLTADQLGQELLFLLGVRPAADLVDAEVGVCAVAEAHRARRSRYFLLRHDMLEIAKPEAAILFLDGDPVEAEFAHLRPKLAREFVLLVDLGGQRRDLLAREALGRLADRVGHFAELEIEHRGLRHGQVSLAGAASRAKTGMESERLCRAALLLCWRGRWWGWRSRRIGRWRRERMRGTAVAGKAGNLHLAEISDRELVLVDL